MDCGMALPLTLVAAVLFQTSTVLCSEFILVCRNSDLSKQSHFDPAFFNAVTGKLKVTCDEKESPEEFCRKFHRRMLVECPGYTNVHLLALGVVILMIIVPMVSLAIFVHVRKAKDDRLLGETLRSLPGMPREFRFRELSQATANFAEENLLGKGGFAKVYKGVLPLTGEEVAVKSFFRETSRGDFLAELTIIHRLRHKNLLRLLGWCYKNKKLLLVYVYMPNGSLDSHLYNPNACTILSWEQRYHILTGVATALNYLHNENDQKVVHGDIKSSNVLLDSAFNSFLGDFGLARAIDDAQTSNEVNDTIEGTYGYIAPECFKTGKVTSKSDVYSFGALVLEVVCGRRPLTAMGGSRLLVEWVWTMHEQGKLLYVVDPRLKRDYDRTEAERLLLLGLACSHPNARERPKMQAVMQVLSKSSPPPHVPLPKPVFVMPDLTEREPPTSSAISSVDDIIMHCMTAYYSASRSLDGVEVTGMERQSLLESQAIPITNSYHMA